jgi:hypothetical protein
MDGYQRIIRDRCDEYGLTIDGWRPDEDGEDDGRRIAVLGRWTATEDGPTGMYFAGDAGELTCSLVGAEEYGNLRAAFYFRPDDTEMGEEVADPGELEPE